MANYTKKIILETFESMLESMPLEKITVTALIRNCNIGRNTFYYHYQDIYALLDDALINWLGQYEEAAQNEDWKVVIKSLLRACQEKKKKIYHIYHSLSRDRLENYMFDRTDSAISAYVRQMAETRNVEPDRAEVIANIVKYSVYGYFMKFLWNGMKDDVEEGVDRLGGVYDELLDTLLH